MKIDQEMVAEISCPEIKQPLNVVDKIVYTFGSFLKTYKTAYRAMKITCVILLIAFLQVSARGTAQTVTLIGKNLAMQQVFDKIEDQTGYGVFIEHNLLVTLRNVDLDEKNVSIDDILQKCFRFQPMLLSYNITGHTINIIISNGRRDEISTNELPGPQEISGIVKSESGSPLEGATVEIVGLKAKGLTNEKGEFSIKGIPNGTYQMEITFVGYDKFISKIVVSNNQLKISASLKQATNSLDQIEVVAYGTTTERLNTGNVTTVTAKQIEQQPVDNPLLALEGRVPGLFITQATGVSGGGISVRVQGQNSISYGNDPLYVIDGVPYASQMLSTTTGGFGGILGSSGTLGSGVPAGGNGNPLSYISPGDIESISVLKDADATAIYGSRAANGAILITTKKGKAGQTKVGFNFQDGWGEVTRKLNVMNIQQYLQMRHEALNNDGISPSSTDYDINGLWDSTKNANWQKLLLGGTAQYTDLSSTVSGGTANTQFLVGATFHRQTSVFPGDFSDQKGNFHFNLNNVSNDQRFHLQISGSYMVDNNQLPELDLTGSAISLAPDAPNLYNPNGSLNWAPDASGTSSWSNPLQYTYSTYQNKTNNLIGNAILSYQIVKGMEIKSSFGYTNLATNELSKIPLESNSPEIQAAYGTTARVGMYTNSGIESWIIEPQASYKNSVGPGKLDVLVGTTIQQNHNNGTNQTGQGFNSDGQIADIFSAAHVYVNSTVISQYKYNALFGRINYNLQDKYIVNLSGRRDGSSRFGPEDQFHNFWAVGGAWIFNQEAIFKNNMKFLSFGKLRGSYGTSGNDQIGDYAFMSLYSTITPQVPYQGINGLGPNSLPNPYLQWEETKKLQFGLDVGLFKNRLLLTTNYVRNRSSNQLLAYQLPSITGFSAINANLPATVQNTEWEFILNSINIKTAKFSWSSSLNLTIPKNQLLAFPNLENSSYASTLVVGQPLSVQKVFHFLGVDPATGEYQFASKSGPTFSPTFGTDNSILVNTSPRFYGGFSNTFNYNGLQLDILFQCVKQTGRNNFNFGNNNPPGFQWENQPVSVLSRWQKPGDITSIQRFNSTNSISYQQTLAAYYSDAGFSNNASFIRLKNVALSYQLPERIIKHLKSQNFRLYIQGQNLLTFTKFKGMDPENQSGSALPPLRVLTVGLKFGF
ncbi:MAG: SusC/RagA family TonB-linked outer membrane protein [Puia sp.]|nr:SusC/RagA family TonB-linked outer membrane protein [Puia sp.]